MPFKELNKPSDAAQHSLKHESRLIDTTLIIIMRASRMLRSSDSKREKTPGDACRQQNVTYLHKNIKRTSRSILAQNIWTQAISMARVRIRLFTNFKWCQIPVENLKSKVQTSLQMFCEGIYTGSIFTHRQDLYNPPAVWCTCLDRCVRFLRQCLHRLHPSVATRQL